MVMVIGKKYYSMILTNLRFDYERDEQHSPLSANFVLSGAPSESRGAQSKDLAWKTLILRKVIYSMILTNTYSAFAPLGSVSVKDSGKIGVGFGSGSSMVLKLSQIGVPL